MEIVVKGRHTEVSERFRQHVVDKLQRLERLGHKVIRIDVEIAHERNPRLSDLCERVELTLASKGPTIRAEAAADDAYAALDLACDKLQMRLRRLADRRRVHHGRKTPVSLASATATESSGAKQPLGEDEAAAGVLPDEAVGGVDGEGPLVVREKTHRGRPMTLDDALFEMELVGHDFFLFCDKETSMPSVVYRRRGYDYGVIRLALED